MTIRSRFACPNATYTTTTTQAPNQCSWESSDGQRILDLSQFAGNSLSAPNSENNELFYVYTPCQNTLKCGPGDLYAMAYFIDYENFLCQQYLAVWDNGINTPFYNNVLDSWQFVYQNGESCNGFEMVFIVIWNCDMVAQTPQVVQAQRNEECSYQMVINASLACANQKRDHR